MKLSIIIPVYNEKDNILKILKKVKSVKIKTEKEIIIVDDFSTDGTRDVLKKIENKSVKVVFHDFNKGKGGAFKTGLGISTGDIIIVQDADLEYNPDEYPKLIEPILKGKAGVVYGSRIMGKSKGHSHLSFYLGGLLVTFFTNILFGIRITDEPTCYKVFKSDVIKNIKINGNRFEWEPEVTAKIAKSGIKIHEVPISYNPRKKSEGKKIKWKDGIEAIWTLVRYRFGN
jgi:glycosyltransferase involved in cell wall biosynthesis